MTHAVPPGEFAGSPRGAARDPTAGADALGRIRVILVGTSHPGNVGSIARAMKTMGLTELVLVAPRDPLVLRHSEAVALASGAADLLEAARVVATLPEALSHCHYAVALSARRRELSVPALDPGGAADLLVERASLGECVALVFGSERYGLDNEDVMRCNAIASIPANPAYTSLNLAMAVQIMAYECRRAALTGAAPAPEGPRSAVAMATHAEREQLFEHLERALVAVGFLDPQHHPKLMHRLRRLFARTGLEADEVNILRGICKAILEHAS